VQENIIEVSFIYLRNERDLRNSFHSILKTEFYYEIVLRIGRISLLPTAGKTPVFKFRFQMILGENLIKGMKSDIGGS
jgi:hypothetical protein